MGVALAYWWVWAALGFTALVSIWVFGREFFRKK